MLNVRSPIYVIVNHPSQGRLDAWTLGEVALDGGAGILQFRCKRPLDAGEFAALQDLAHRAAALGVPLLVNDFADIAQKVGAAGVHVGQQDENVAELRRVLGEAAIIGVTTPSVELAQRAASEGASYVAVGAMYPSPTKPEKPVLGPERLRAVAEAVRLPVCAIGGITAERVPELLAAGASLLAVISAVANSPDPAEAVRKLVAAALNPEAERLDACR